MHVKLHSADELSHCSNSTSAKTPSLPRSNHHQQLSSSAASSSTTQFGWNIEQQRLSQLNNSSQHQLQQRQEREIHQEQHSQLSHVTIEHNNNQDLQLQLPRSQNNNSSLRHWDNDTTVTTRRRKQFVSRAHPTPLALPDRNTAQTGGTKTPPDLDYCIYTVLPIQTMTTTSTMTAETTNSTIGSSGGGGGENPRPSITDVMTARYSKTFGNLNPHVLQTACWLGVASLAAVGIYLHHGSKGALEFLTAYIVEYSLSIDNLFVFMVIFQYFRVSDAAQETALNWGVVGAMVLRGAMILLGKALVDKFHFVTVFFAGILLYSSAKLLFTDEDDDEDLENNGIVKFAKRLFPCTDKYHGDRFFVVDADGRALATPLLVVLITVELSDVVFALDSVPAVLGLSKSTLVIYSSNILAVMGLRSLFFVVSDAIKDLRFLQQALALVLGFIGVKMIMASLLKIEIPVLLSLGLVVGTLFVGVLLSVLFPAPDNGSDVEADAADPDDELAEEGTRDQPPTEALLV